MSSVVPDWEQVDEIQDGRLTAPDGDQLALFHRTLAALCRSELPLPRAFALLEDDLDGTALQPAIREMARKVRAGLSLDEAYAEREECFPPLYRSLVEAGMRAGDLPAALDEIAAHAARETEIDHRFRRALAYPTITAAVVLTVGIGLFVFVAPSFEAIAQTADAALWTPLRTVPGSTSLADGFGSRFAAALIALGFLVLACAGAWLTLRIRSPFERSRVAEFVRFRVPFLGRLRLHAALSSLAATLALLVRRKVPLGYALDLTAESTADPELRKRVRAMADAASDGHGLADSVRQGDLFSPSLLWLLESAEERGEGEAALADIAAIYRARLDRAVDRASMLVTPAMEVVIGVVACVIALSFVVPLMEVAGAIMGLSVR